MLPGGSPAVASGTVVLFKLNPKRSYQWIVNASLSQLDGANFAPGAIAAILVPLFRRNGRSRTG
jgi:hypothetical protein